MHLCDGAKGFRKIKALCLFHWHGVGQRALNSHPQPLEIWFSPLGFCDFAAVEPIFITRAGYSLCKRWKLGFSGSWILGLMPPFEVSQHSQRIILCHAYTCPVIASTLPAAPWHQHCVYICTIEKATKDTHFIFKHFRSRRFSTFNPPLPLLVTLFCNWQKTCVISFSDMKPCKSHRVADFFSNVQVNALFPQFLFDCWRLSDES